MTARGRYILTRGVDLHQSPLHGLYCAEVRWRFVGGHLPKALLHPDPLRFWNVWSPERHREPTARPEDVVYKSNGLRARLLLDAPLESALTCPLAGFPAAAGQF